MSARMALQCGCFIIFCVGGCSTGTPVDGGAYRDGGATDGSDPPDAGGEDGGTFDAGSDRLDAGSVHTDAGGFDGGLISFADQIVPIFQQHCIECHSLAGAFDLSAEFAGQTLSTWQAQVVCFEDGVSTMRPIVDPGVPDNSLLWIKIADIDFSLECGREMPLGQPGGPLLLAAPDMAELIRQWILQGASLD